MNGFEVKLIGSNLIKLRHRAGLSQKQVSRLSGLTQQHISFLESGKIAGPTLHSLFRLAAVYSCNIYDILNTPTETKTVIKDDDGTYNVSQDDIEKYLNEHPEIRKFIFLQIQYFRNQPFESTATLVDLFALSTTLSIDQRKKLIDIINIIKDFQ